MKLPTDYLQFMSGRHGIDGLIGSTYISLWRLEELEQRNDAYKVSEFAPGLRLFGTDGGGEGFAFDENDAVVIVPLVGLSLKEARPIAPSFTAFLRGLSPQDH